VLVLTDVVVVADIELDFPSVPLTDDVDVFAVAEPVIPILAETVVPVDTVGVVDDGGDCVGGADV